uniref:Tc1-like transposase DDE domain-containing protein n=1 Tax=Paramormyrops kingsleyae TaxID=1676925 RepID=A0A3B3TAU6_9TELE
MSLFLFLQGKSAKDIHTDVTNTGGEVSFLQHCQNLDIVFQEWAFHRILFLQDNAPEHTSNVVAARLNTLGFQLVHHPTYSPDLAPSDYYLIPNLKKHLKGQHFDAISDVKDAAESWFAAQSKDFYLNGLEKLQLCKCISLRGEYVE